MKRRRYVPRESAHSTMSRQRTRYLNTRVRYLTALLGLKLPMERQEVTSELEHAYFEGWKAAMRLAARLAAEARSTSHTKTSKRSSSSSAPVTR